MASSDGVITREDVIKQDALNWGPEYVAQINMSVVANKQMASSLKEINDQASKFRNASSQQEYITLKNQQALANQKVIDSEKQLALSEVNMEKIEQERIKTQKAKLDLDKKEEASKKVAIKLTVEERVQNEINNRAEKQAALDKLGLVGAYVKLNKSRTEAKRTLLDLMAAENQDVEAIRKAQAEFDKLDKKVRTADKAVGDFTKNVGNYPTLKGLTSNLRDLAGAFGIIGGVQAFASIIGGAVQTIRQFEQSLADLSAITGASGKDLAFLRDNAIDLGQKVEGGAQAVVEAYKLIAGAKPELLSNVKALNQVTEAAITLSQAAGITLPDSATALTDAMNQFGAGADEAQRFIDALANGAKFGSAEIPQLTEALLKFGAVARSSNVSIEESAALVELLAENGLKGADAGTALRNVLLKISAPNALPKLARQEFDRLGISLQTLADKSIPIQEKLEMLKPLLKDNASIVKVFGLENSTAAINVISHTDRLKELTGQMGEVGTAAEQAAIRMNTLNGKTEILKSTYDSFILSIGKGSGAISEFFKFFIDGAKNALIDLIRLNTSWDELFGKAAQEGAASGVKTFQQQFNELVSPKISEKERNNIRQRLKEINAALSAGYDDPSLTTEKSTLLKRLGLGSDEEIAIAVSRAAQSQRKTLQEELKKTEQKLKDFNPYALNFSGTSGKDLKLEKERLIKAIAEQGQIIIEGQKKLRSIAKGNLPASSETPIVAGTDESDKELKARLKKAKELSDGIFKLKEEELKRNIKVNQEITDDDKLSDDIRILSAENVRDSQNELIELSKQNALDYDKFVLKDEKLTEEQKSLITFQAYSNRVDAAEKYQKDLKKIREFDSKEYEDEIKRGTDMVSIATENALAAENDRYNKLKALGFKNDKEKEKAAEDHERKLFEIKKAGLIAQTKLQINALNDTIDDYEAQSDGSQESQDFILKKRAEVAKLSAQLTEAEGTTFNENEKKKAKTAKEQTEDILEISTEALGHLADLSNAFSERKLQKIDEEIDKNNAYYDNQIKLAGDDEKQKELLEQERAKKEAILQKKKVKEQEKQAKFDKAVAIAQIAIQTALSIIKASPVVPLMVLAAAAGAIALATAIATPIPKYKTGRKGGPREKAIVGDGGVQEVIERKSGKIELTPARDTLVELMAGDNVYKDIDDFKRNGRHTVLAGNLLEQKKMNEYHNITIKDNGNSREVLKELKLTRKAIQKQKLIVKDSKQPDLNHELWKYKNVKS